MAPPDSETKHLQCPRCGSEFRIRPREGRELPPAVPCPTCETDIPMGRGSRDGFWVEKSRAEMFGRDTDSDPSTMPASEEPVRPPEADVSPAPAGSRPDRSRSFRGVSEVRSDGRSVLPDDRDGGRSDAEPRGESAETSGWRDDNIGASDGVSSESSGDGALEAFEWKPSDADFRAIEEELESVAAEATKDTEGTPPPEPADRSEESSKAREESADGAGDDGERGSRRSERKGDGRTEDAQRPKPAIEIAKMEAAEVDDEGPRADGPDASGDVDVGRGAGEETPTSTTPSGGRGQPLQTAAAGAAIVLALVAVALTAVAYFRDGRDIDEAEASTPSSAVTADAGTDGGRGDRRASIREATRAARSAVRTARSPHHRARIHLRNRRYRRARRLAIRAMTNRGIRADLREIYDRAIRRDESLRPSTRTVGEDIEIEAVHALGGGWSVSFRMVGPGDEQFAFKPAQKHWERGWRAEIAAYHLCEMIVCNFEIPRNRPVRIRRERFMRLYGRVDNDDQRAYREKFEKLVWVEEEGPDGNVHEYLYGTLKDWVPEFVKWPIEYQTLWEPLLNADYPRSRLEDSLEEALEPLQDRGPIDFYSRILNERGPATTRSTARGISSILSFDYLTTNWDRFSTAEKFYGVNNQFAGGRFISIDNGAAFSRHRFDSVERRLLPVTRFSEAMVMSIRVLRPEVANAILFPDPTEEERARLSIFWEQRDRFLDRVHALIAEHGERSILTFR